jgi:hypothetical protein
MRHVCLFRHALALDERRVKYLPEYAHGGLSAGDGLTVLKTLKGDFEERQVKEVWFAGTHSDV